MLHAGVMTEMLWLADIARAVSLDHYGRAIAQEVKADRSIVTAADHAVEQALRAEIKKLGWGVIGEEGADEDLDADYVAILDPIDGTHHYLIGDDNFFTLIALHHKTDGFIAGLCDQPARQHLWTAARGQGAQYHDKDKKTAKRLSGAPGMPLSDAILASFNPLSLDEADFAFYRKLASVCKTAVPGGDAGNYARLASGHLGLVLEKVGGLYDVAPFIPMLAETGGAICRLVNGQPQDLTLMDKGALTILAAANKDLLSAALTQR